MEGFTTTLQVYDRDVQFLIKDKRLNEQHFLGIQKLYEDHIQKSAKFRDNIAKYDGRFTKKDERKNEALNEGKAIIVAIERNQRKLAQTTREYAELFEKITQTRQDSQHCRNELYA
jgi:translation elongation factor EF-1alpha